MQVDMEEETDFFPPTAPYKMSTRFSMLLQTLQRFLHMLRQPRDQLHTATPTGWPNNNNSAKDQHEPSEKAPQTPAKSQSLACTFCGK